MFDRLLAIGFQVHDKIDIELGSSITTIRGDSDSGKSSLLRALRWVCLNKPRGDGFIKHGEICSRVRLKFDDVVITREKSKKDNLYQIKKDGQSEEFKAFGNDVPPAISQLLNVGEINFSGQHEGSFWFSLSPPELARQINKIVDLELIDNTFSKIDSRIRTQRMERGIVQSKLEKSEVENAKLNFVRFLDKDLGELEEIDNQINVVHKKAVNISRNLNRLLTLNTTVVACTNAAKMGKIVVECGERATAISGRVSRLRSLMNTINDKNREIENNRKESKLCQDRLQTESGGVCPLCGHKLKEE